ncbi:MAG: GNAT family N-acetyltransferase [Vampirovibrionales bacterium]|nr:GNAT family N-acetyltransferase [Vampirovibrionales bacterium]
MTDDASFAPLPAPDVRSLRIRRLETRDIELLMAIESVSFGRFFWSADIFHRELRNPGSRYYALTDDRESPDRLIGYNGLWKMRDEAHFTTVAIHPHLRRRSLGELMHCHLLGVSVKEGVRWITTEIRGANVGSQNLCYKYGFYAVGLRRRYYQDNEEDALVMVSPDLRSHAWQTLYNRRKAELRTAVGGAWPSGFSV